VRVLLLGASGYLGAALFAYLCRHHDVVGTALSRLRPGLFRVDVTDDRALTRFLRQPADLVVHSAGLVDLVAAERDPSAAWAVNAHSAEVVARHAEARVVYISTDNVYAGSRDSYREADPPDPINEYGRSKLFAEGMIGRCAENTVLRVPMLIGAGTGGPDDKFLTRLSGRRTIAQTDVVTNPVYVPDLLRDFDRLCRLRGVVHYGGASIVSRFELMTLARRMLGLRTTVVPVAGADVPPGDLRPRRLVLASDRHGMASRPLSAALSDLAARRRAPRQ
jgi:dTDP-4-dehydrorhamnose reductase